MIEFRKSLSDDEDLLARLTLDCKEAEKDLFLNKSKGYLVSDNFENDFAAIIDTDDVHRIAEKSYLSILVGRSGNTFDFCGKRSRFTTYHSPTVLEQYDNFRLERFNTSDVFDNDVVNLISNNTVLPYNLYHRFGCDGFYVHIKEATKYRLIERHLPDGVYDPSDDVFKSATVLYGNGRAKSVRFFYFVAEVDIPLSPEVIERLDNKVPTNFHLDLLDDRLAVIV